MTNRSELKESTAWGAPAPAERAVDAELTHMVEIAKSSPLFAALLNWIDGMVFVLNRHRQIVLASDEVAEMLRVDSADRLIGLRLGEAMGCVHVEGAAGGCGTTEHCRFCGALKAILDAKRFHAPTASECRLTLRTNGHAETMKLRAKTSQAKRRDEEFTVVVLQRADRLERAPTVAAETDMDEDWPIGIESYYRVRKLGTGGMGSVFLARDEQRRSFAIKTIKASLAGDDAVMARFVREIRLSIVLDHPHIVRTLRANQTVAGTVYMITEYCPNGSAGQWLQRSGRLSLETGLSWMLGCASALHYAWKEHRLIHRDIKPDNLLLDADNRVKLADFGVARRAREQDSKMTNAGTVIGSVHYMAPEQAAGASEVDSRADLYGLGATFYELFSGQTPFDGPTPAVILSRKMTRRPPHLGALRPDLPAALAESIDALLATSPSERPNDAQALLERLRSVAAAAHVETSTVNHSTPLVRQPDGFSRP